MTATSARVMSLPSSQGPPLASISASMRSQVRRRRASAASISALEKPVWPMVSMNSLRSGFDSAIATKSSRLIFWKPGRKARLKVGKRTAAAGISST